MILSAPSLPQEPEASYRVVGMGFPRTHGSLHLAEAKQAAAAGPAVWNQWNSLRMRVMIFISHMCYYCLTQLSHLVLCLHSCPSGTSIPVLQERKLKPIVSVALAPSLYGLLRVPAVYSSSSRRWGHSN